MSEKPEMTDQEFSAKADRIQKDLDQLAALREETDKQFTDLNADFAQAEAVFPWYTRWWLRLRRWR